MTDTQRVKIKADIMWAFLDRKNDMSGKYQVDLCNLTDPAVQALESMGLAVRFKDGKGNFITCKSNNTIIPHGKDGDTLEGVAIGNGSKAVALVGAYEWSWKNKQGVSPSLKKLVIEEIVSYEGVSTSPDSDDDEVL